MKLLSFAKFCRIRIFAHLLPRHWFAQWQFLKNPSKFQSITHFDLKKKEKAQLLFFYLFSFDVYFGDMNLIHFTGPFEEVSIVIGHIQCTPSIN